jgi:hypothetical protein
MKHAFGCCKWLSNAIVFFAVCPDMKSAGIDKVENKVKIPG